MPCDLLKHRFTKLTGVAFCAGQEKLIELKVAWEDFKHRFMDLIQVEFWACQVTENDF